MSTARRIRRAAGMLVVLAVLVVWAVELRPQFLGGPTALVVVSGTSMEPGLHTGDMVLVRREAGYRTGDIVAYRIPAGNAGAGSVVIHRIVGGSAKAGYVLRGDNRDRDDLWHPRDADVLGSRLIALPTHGRIGALLFSPLALATLAAILAFFFVAWPSARPPRPEPEAT